VTYKAAGENIAHGQRDVAAACEKAFMNSTGHRDNILNKNYTHIGIGIVGSYYTQEFAGL